MFPQQATLKDTTHKMEKIKSAEIRTKIYDYDALKREPELNCGGSGSLYIHIGWWIKLISPFIVVSTQSPKEEFSPAR